MNNIQDLLDFVDSAVRSRKYPENTAYGIKAALKLFDAELNDEERFSLDKFRQNIDAIYTSVYQKNKLKFSAASLNIYKSRVLRVMSDFNKYGTDPQKMASWSPKAITRTKSTIKTTSKPAHETVGYAEPTTLNTTNEVELVNAHKIELALRPNSNTKFTIIMPRDLSMQESIVIKSIIDSLVVEHADDNSNTQQ